MFWDEFSIQRIELINHFFFFRYAANVPDRVFAYHRIRVLKLRIVHNFIKINRVHFWIIETTMRIAVCNVNHVGCSVNCIAIHYWIIQWMLFFSHFSLFVVEYILRHIKCAFGLLGNWGNRTPNRYDLFPPVWASDRSRGVKMFTSVCIHTHITPFFPSTYRFIG